jgi:hypothetical protein
MNEAASASDADAFAAARPRLVTDGTRIVAIYAVRNPDKLVGLPALG